MLATGTAFAITYLQVTMSLPLTLLVRGLPVAEAGILLTVSAVTIVLGQPLLRWGPLRGRTGFEAMSIGYAVLAAGLAATAFATTLPGFVVATVVWSTGDVLLLGHSWSIVSALAPEGARARYLAAYGLSWGVAAVVAPVLGTQLLSAGGPVVLWMTLAAVALLLATVQPGLARRCAVPSPSLASEATAVWTTADSDASQG